MEDAHAPSVGARSSDESQAAPALDLARLRELAFELGLAPVVHTIVALARWAIVLEPALETTQPARRSRIGRLRHLPTGTKWPTLAETHSSLVAQIALDEVPVAGATLDAKLVRRTLLSFFALQADATSEVVDGEVVVHPPDAAIERYLRGEARARDGQAVSMRAVLTLPSAGQAGSDRMRSLGLRDAHWPAYARLVAATEEAQRISRPRWQLFGHPDRIDDDILQEAALGETWDEQPDGFSASALRHEARKWRTLLRIDSDASLRWPGGGTTYFCGRADSLSRGLYSHVRAFSRAQDEG